MLPSPLSAPLSDAPTVSSRARSERRSTDDHARHRARVSDARRPDVDVRAVPVVQSSGPRASLRRRLATTPRRRARGEASRVRRRRLARVHERWREGEVLARAREEGMGLARVAALRRVDPGDGVVRVRDADTARVRTGVRGRDGETRAWTRGGDSARDGGKRGGEGGGRARARRESGDARETRARGGIDGDGEKDEGDERGSEGDDDEVGEDPGDEARARGGVSYSQKHLLTRAARRSTRTA